MTDDFSAISGEQGGYVPCDEEAAGADASVQDYVAVYGEDGGFVAADMGASADEPDTMDSAAIAGRGSGFVAKPCDDVDPGSITFLDTFSRNSYVYFSGLYGGPDFTFPAPGPIATDSGHFWNNAGKSVRDGFGYLTGSGGVQESGAEVDATNVPGFTNSEFRLEVDFEVFPYDHELSQRDIDFSATDSNDWYEVAPDNTFSLYVDVHSAANTHQTGFSLTNTALNVFAESSGPTTVAGSFGGGAHSAVLTVSQSTGVVTVVVDGVTVSGTYSLVSPVPRLLYVVKTGFGSVVAFNRIESFDL